MKKGFLLSVLLFLLISVQAQNFKITGEVIDGSSGEAIPGVNVTIKGSTVGVSTDIDGHYEISAKEGDMLVFSFIGYNNRVRKVLKKSVINVRLDSNVEGLDEVVVIGYGTMKKSDLTGAVSSVKSEALQQAQSVNIAEALQGHTAGVMISSNEGSPGAGMSIQIRGASSLNASSQPLYVIDGFPIEMQSLGINTGISGSQPSPLNDIDPSSIESIEILKDASATAIYGARGANGVILVTTKGGKIGKSKISVDITGGVQVMDSRLDLLDSRGYAEYMYLKEGMSEDSEFKNYNTYADSTNTDWQDELFNLGEIKNVNVALTGGTKKTIYAISGGLYDHKGIVGNNNRFKRYTSNINLTHKYSSKLDINVNLKLAHTNTNGVATGGSGTPKNAGIVRQIMRARPTRSVDYKTETLDDLDDSGTVQDLTNPMLFVNEVVNNNTTTRIIGNAAATYRFLPGFSLKVRGGVNNNKVKYQAFYPKTTGKGKYDNGLAIMGNNEFKTWVNENILTYIKMFNDHSVNVMGAFALEETEMFKSEMENTQFEYDNLNINAIQSGTLPRTPTSKLEKSSLMSYLGRFNYSYKGRYMLTASFRADGSSRFGTENKWGYFPSGSLAWRASEEKFIKDLGFISNLKFRASYGQTGNQRIGNYLSISQFSIENYVFNDVVSSGLAPKSIGDTKLKWETTAQSNLGFDLGLFNNRVLFTAEAYYKKTSDMLLKVNVPVTSGVYNYMTNIGDMENKGLEFSLSTVNVKTKDFTWTTDMNISFNRNKVTKLGVGQEYMDSGYGSRIILDKPIGLWWGYEQDGIYETQEQVDAEVSKKGKFWKNVSVGNRKLKDQDGNGKIDEDDRVVIGSYEPKHFGGISNTFKYKNVSLAVFMVWRYGGEIYNANRVSLEGKLHETNRSASVLEYWDPVLRPDSDIPIPGSDDYMGALLDTHMEDGSFLRLKAVSLTYDFDKSLAKRMSITSGKVFVKGDNLLLFTNYTGYDPEVNMGGALSPGYDYGAYPKATTVSVGLNIVF